MWKPLIRCSIVGGVIVFLWMMVVWMILPMHKSLINVMGNEGDVTSAILEGAPQDGVYVIPKWDNSQGQTYKGKRGPFIFMSVKRQVDFSNMTTPMVVGLITYMVGAGLITYLLLKAKAMKYWERVRFVTIAGVAVALLGAMPAWNWWHFPGNWAFFEFMGIAIGWFIAGLVIAKLIKN